MSRPPTGICSRHRDAARARRPDRGTTSRTPTSTAPTVRLQSGRSRRSGQLLGRAVRRAGDLDDRDGRSRSRGQRCAGDRVAGRAGDGGAGHGYADHGDLARRMSTPLATTSPLELSGRQRLLTVDTTVLGGVGGSQVVRQRDGHGQSWRSLARINTTLGGRERAGLPVGCRLHRSGHADGQHERPREQRVRRTADGQRQPGDQRGSAELAPVAASQSVNTNEDTAKTITLSASDADGDDPLTFAKGTLADPRLARGDRGGHLQPPDAERLHRGCALHAGSGLLRPGQLHVHGERRDGGSRPRRRSRSRSIRSTTLRCWPTSRQAPSLTPRTIRPPRSRRHDGRGRRLGQLRHRHAHGRLLRSVGPRKIGSRSATRGRARADRGVGRQRDVRRYDDRHVHRWERDDPAGGHVQLERDGRRCPGAGAQRHLSQRVGCAVDGGADGAVRGDGRRWRHERAGDARDRGRAVNDPPALAGIEALALDYEENDPATAVTRRSPSRTRTATSPARR